MDNRTALKRQIIEKGVKQTWLAEQLGVTNDTISRWVVGENIPKADQAVKLATLLGCTVDELFGENRPITKEL